MLQPSMLYASLVLQMAVGLHQAGAAASYEQPLGMLTTQFETTNKIMVCTEFSGSHAGRTYVNLTSVRDWQSC